MNGSVIWLLLSGWNAVPYYLLTLSFVKFSMHIQFESRYPFLKQDDTKSIYGVPDSQLSDIRLPMVERVFWENFSGN